MGHLNSVELTPSNTNGGSKTGDDLFLFLFGEHLHFGYDKLIIKVKTYAIDQMQWYLLPIHISVNMTDKCVLDFVSSDMVTLD